MGKAAMRFVRLSFGEWPERIPGDEAGDVEYAITREEWEADRAAGPHVPGKPRGPQRGPASRLPNG